MLYHRDMNMWVWELEHSLQKAKTHEEAKAIATVLGYVMAYRDNDMTIPDSKQEELQTYIKEQKMTDPADIPGTEPETFNIKMATYMVVIPIELLEAVPSGAGLIINENEYNATVLINDDIATVFLNEYGDDLIAAGEVCLSYQIC